MQHNDDIQDLSVQNNEENNPSETISENQYSEVEDNHSSPDQPQSGSNSQESKFKEGQKLTMINVRFPGNAKSHPFLVGKKKLNYNQKVLAMSDRGMTIGYVNSFPYEVEYHPSMLPIKSISQIPSDADIKAKNDLEEKEKQTEDVCKRLIEKHQLDMIITHVEIIQFGKKAVFYFNSPSRVDFRGLVKDLVSELKMRIELRQISIRDRAAGLGAISSCGQKTCCSYFLKDYGNVSIKMAKNQNLTLLPGKINGVCGQIKCCMRFENDHYTEKRNMLPRENALIKTRSKDMGKVIRLNLMDETFDLITKDGVKKRFYRDEYLNEDSYVEMPDFPTRFEHIIDETQTIIGLPKKVCNEDCQCDPFCPSKTQGTVDAKEDLHKEEREKPERTDQNQRTYQNRSNDRQNHRRHHNKNYSRNQNRNNRGNQS